MWMNVIKKLMSLGMDPARIPQPPGMGRRDFLKAVGITAVSVSVPAGISRIEKSGQDSVALPLPGRMPPDKRIEGEKYELGFYAWETIGSAVGHTAGLVRADVKSAANQNEVPLYPDLIYPDLRDVLAQNLLRDIEHEGKDPASTLIEAFNINKRAYQEKGIESVNRYQLSQNLLSNIEHEGKDPASTLIEASSRSRRSAI